MLAGRESLVRLIGKRRRNLPRHILPDDRTKQPPSSPPPSSSPFPILPDNSCCKKSELSCLEDAGGTGDCANGVVWMECPVCGRSIRGTESMMNSHLDLCLARGTKRKLVQGTLFRFCTTRSKGQVKLGDPENRRNEVGEKLVDVNCESNGDYVPLGSRPSSECGGQEDKMETALYSPTNGSIQQETLIGDAAEASAMGGEFEDTLPSALSISSTKESELLIKETDDVLSITVLDTVVVGHRYHNEHKLAVGDSVYILRDPGNANDQNAIKVICSNSENGMMVGYLPKELSKYLSPLISRYNLKFEGSVTSTPKHHFDAVEIQLFCQGILSSDDMDPNDVQHLKRSWGDILHAVEHGKTYVPNMTRYQQNFNVIIHEVLDRYGYHFMGNEKSFIESFGSLSNESQRVFIRLYTRQGPWFRTSNVSYLEVKDAEKAIKELQLAGYVCPFSFNGESCKSDIPEVLNLLTVFELRKISKVAQLKNQKGIRCRNKAEVINKLSSAYGDGTCPLLPNLIMERTGTCIKVSSAAELLLWRIQRLFFLSGEQDLSTFLLVDLGVIKYPSYRCNISKPIFQDRINLLAYEEAIAIAQIMDESIEENDREMVMRCVDFSDTRIPYVPETSTTFLSCFSSSWVYSKVVTLGISFCERERRYEDAVKLLKGLLKRILWGGKRGYWTFRLSVDLEHLGYISESLLVAEEGITDPWVRAGSKHALQRRVLRLGMPPRRWKKPSFAESINRKIKEVHVRGRPLNRELGTKNRYYGYDGEQCGVEQLALQYYAGEGGGWMGVHAESGIWMTIFGLLMWDVIFWDIPDVFQTRFQTAPLDLETDSFYISRKDIIECHLRKFQDGMAEEMLISSWEIHMGTACKGINWDRHCLADLRSIVSCIGGRCLAAFCRQLAQDYKSWSSGMPDLLLWRFFGGDGDGGEVKVVEVKGPRDRLSEQQRAWMLILMDCGFDTEVCRVSAPPQSLE